MNKLFLGILSILLISCGKIELEEVEKYTNTNIEYINYSNAEKDSLICEGIYGLFPMKSIILNDSLPNLKYGKYHIPTKEEAKILQKYIVANKRTLCYDINTNTFYTFSPTNITKAGFKTEYNLLYIRVTNSSISFDINIDTTWTEINHNF